MSPFRPLLTCLLLMLALCGCSTFEKTIQRGAEAGNAVDQKILSRMYSKGEGVPQNYAEAAKWMRKAADQGYDEAQSNVGKQYYFGQGVPKDYAEAAKWIRKAANKGYATAQYYLGFMYLKGQGVPEDYVNAYVWMSLALASDIAAQLAEKQTGHTKSVTLSDEHRKSAENINRVFGQKFNSEDKAQASQLYSKLYNEIKPFERAFEK
jgi:hypothetical protein